MRMGILVINHAHAQSPQALKQSPRSLSALHELLGASPRLKLSSSTLVQLNRPSPFNIVIGGQRQLTGAK